MGKAIIIISALAVLAAIALFNAGDNIESHHKLLFNVWAQTHGKQYADATEETYRFTIWRQNLDYVKAHNEKYLAGEESYEL